MMRRQTHETTNWGIMHMVGASLLMICQTMGSSAVGLGAEPLPSSESNPQHVSPGSLVICGGGVLPGRLLDRFVELGGGPKARVVVISSASIAADLDIHARLSGWHDRLAENTISSFDILHTRLRKC